MAKRGPKGGRQDHKTSRRDASHLQAQVVAGDGLWHSQDNEINAHIPERFRGSAHPSLTTHSSSSNGPDMKLNHNIRAYARASDDIINFSSSGWLRRPEVPTTEEVLLPIDDEVELPPNPVDKQWKNKRRYLKTHYELLREDAVSPLRDAVDLFRGNPDMMENDNKVVSIYEKVHVAGFTFAPLGVAARIRFSTTRVGKAVPWKVSKRLQAGTLVALTPTKDKFKTTCIIAIVAARPIAGVEGTPPEIDIYFSRAEDIEIDPQLEWTMVEAKNGYFEANRHVLRALQKLSGESFPLSEEICTLSRDIKTPSYLSSRPNVDLRAMFSGSDQEYAMQNINILENWPPASEENLDQTQWAALQQILTKRLAIIQGPPGTGKTHVSKMALQVLIENKKPGDPPIVVAAQTNHALDQLLNHIAKFDPEYIRLGGQTRKPEIKKRSLYEVRQLERLSPLPGGLLGNAKKQMDILARQMKETLSPLDSSEAREPFSAKTLLELGVLSQAQAASLDAAAARWVKTGDSESENSVRHWVGKALMPFRVFYKQDNFGFSPEEIDLEYEQITELQAEMGVIDDEDIENLRGPWCTVDDSFTVAKASEPLLNVAQKLLRVTSDLWKIKENLRGPIYGILQAQAKAKILANFREQAKTFEKLVRDLKVGKWERDAQYLERANIIGMTTTGLSKYRPLVSSLKPKIILIEEAAEIGEAPVTAACVESLEHLILVGDHQQLQGQCNVQELGVAPYHLNVSMFERLVRNNMPFKTLLRQRRMDPEFRRLLYPIYPQLQDHPDVVNRQSLPVGLGDLKSFFFHHENYENRDAQSSCFNEFEAEFIAGFYHYLLQNSANPPRITIITFYNAQRKLILDRIKNRQQLASHYTNVVTVDSYQGEENDIVILSLVRNNRGDDIGFLKIDNRVCVALSRAKFGFYVFGNRELLAQASPLWSKVIDIMATDPNRVGDKFPIVCKKHGRQTLITYWQEWQNCAGGCNLDCSELLPCTHPCPLKCHPYAHDDMECQEPCRKVLSYGHKCAKKCFEKPCFCYCDQFADKSRTTIDEPPDMGGSFGDQPLALERGNGGSPWTNTTSIGGYLSDKPSQNKEVRGNNNRNSNGEPSLPNKSYSSQSHSSQSASYGSGIISKASTALTLKVPTTQSVVGTKPHSPSASGEFLRKPSTLPDFAFSLGQGSLYSSEKQTEMLADWTNFAAGGVKKDDGQREKLAAAEAKLAMQQRFAEASLIDFEDADGFSSPVKDETVGEMKNGRKKFTQEYLPSHKANHGFGYSTTPSMGSSGSGQSSGQQSLVDLLN